MRRNRILSMTVAAVVCLGSISAFAAQGEKDLFDKTEAPKAQEWEAKNFNMKMGERVELTEEEKAAKLEEMKAALAEKLANGEISQEQYDAVIERMESGKAGFGRMGGMMKGKRGFGQMPHGKEGLENPENKGMGEGVMKGKRGEKPEKVKGKNTTEESADIA